MFLSGALAATSLLPLRRVSGADCIVLCSALLVQLYGLQMVLSFNQYLPMPQPPYPPQTPRPYTGDRSEILDQHGLSADRQLPVNIPFDCITPPAL